MNAQFQVAQATGTAIPTNTTPVRTFTLAKPLTDQAVVVHLGYDQKVKLDFSAIANEKITLVHVGEKLIILFDNKSTITVDPVFDSRHDDQHLLSIELAPGRDVNVQEFASLFPITTDQSVLPAAGDGNGNAQGSGANFSNAAVDTLNAGNPLDLLGQEQLGNFVLNPETFAGLPATTPPSAGFTLSNTIVIHDETVNVQILNGANDQPSAGLPAVFSAVGLIGWAQSAVSEIASSSVGFGSGGTGTIAYALTTSTGAAFAGVDSGLQATVTGNEIFLFTEGNLVVGREGAGGVADPNGAVAFQLYLDPASLKLDVAQYEAIKHGTASAPDTSEGAQLGDVVFVQQTVTDGSGNTATALSTGSLGVSFLDDGPTVTRGEGSEQPSIGLLNLDETIGHEDSPLTDRYNTGETESNGVTPNGTLDDTGVTTITVSTAPTQGQAIGELSTPAGGLANLFPAALVDFGTDGPGPDGGVSNVLKLVLSSETVGTNLTATALAGTSLAGLDAAARSIVLVQVNDTTIEGRIVGDGVANNGDEYVAFRISLVDASDPATAHITVDQFLAIDHGGSEDPSVFDEQIFLHLAGTDALGLQLTTTVTDGDGDQASSTVQVNLIGSENSFIAFDDDGPMITREEGEHPTSPGLLNLDETIAHGDSPQPDTYNVGESESGFGPSNGTADDKAATVTVAIHPTQGQAIGELSTTAGALAELFDTAVVDFGTDGPGAEGGISNVLKLVLSGDTVDTNLTATALVGTPLENLTAAQRAIVLVQVDDNTLEGRIVGDGAAEHEYVAFRITLDDATDPSGATITVDQFLPIDHGGSENPSQFDEQTILHLVGNGTLNLELTTTATDGDGDQTSSSVQVTLIGNERSFIAFDDDGPTVAASETKGFAVVHDETLLLQSPPFGDDNDILFTPVFNGVSNPGHDPQVLFGLPIGYAQSNVAALTIDNVNFGTDGAAKTGAQLFSLTLTDAQGQSTTGPIDSNLATTEGREIFLFLENGLIVGRYDGGDPGNDVTSTNDPAAFAIAIDPVNGKVSVVQYVSLHHNSADIGGDIDEAVSLAGALGQVKATVTVTDGDGDRASASANIGGGIQFEDDGPLVAATLSRNFGVTADETPGNQASDVAGPLQIFAGVQNPGVDPDEPGSPLAYATSSGAALSILPYFGVDGPDPAAAITYSLELKSSNSGVTLTDGTAISLSLDSAGRVIGTVGTDNVHPELSGMTAFAVAIDPVSGKVSVVEYLSLHHSSTSNPNDQVSLAAGSISAVVTIKDGDGDTASASADISSKIHFNDDGPTLISETSINANVDEDGLHAGLSDSNPDLIGPPSEVTGTNSAVATSATYGQLDALVDFGADGFGSFGLKTMPNGPQDSGLTSKGGHILIVTDANGLHGYVETGASGFDAGDREVFTLTVGADGSYAFALHDQVDHPALDEAPGDNTENTLVIDLSSYVTATDGDGDSIPLGSGAFTVTVLDDIPVITARPPTETEVTTTETFTYTLQAGNTDIRAMDGQNNHDIVLTGIDLNANDDSVNTTGSKIGVGNGQIIDGFDNQPLSGPEILTMAFFDNVSITGNPQSPTVSHGSAYSVNTASFSIDVAEAKNVETAVVFISAIEGGNFVDLTFTVNGSPVGATAVFDGNTHVQIGYVLDGVPDLSTVKVIGSTAFDTLNVGNYDNFQFNSSASGDPQTLTDGNSFKVYGIESTIVTTTTVTETFKVSEDESAGVNSLPDPNPANDTSDVPPAAIFEANAIGYAKSASSVLDFGSLFTGKVGADEPGTYSFAVTDKNGNALTGVDSGLTTLDGTHILLTTEQSGAVVGMAGQTEVFRVYADSTGYVWIAHYQAIHNDVAGSSQAAYDDIATVTADLHLKGSLTDFDGDTTSVVSPVALNIQFQDDGPLAVNDFDSVAHGDLVATGNVITGHDIPGGDSNATDGVADSAGTDGAKITEVAGVTTVTTPNGANDFVVAGQFGTLTINEHGDYTYTRFNGSPVVGNDVFTYTLTDGDGDFSTAKLTINVTDNGVLITGIGAQGGDETVDEANLPGGSSPNTPALTQTGTFTINAADGLDSLVIDSHTVISGGVFTGGTFVTSLGNTLSITGFDGTHVSYSYTLVTNEAHLPGQGANSLIESFAITATDTDGDAAISSLTISIVDDVPTAVADTDSVAAGSYGAATGNVLTGGTDLLDANTTDGVADTQGADGATVVGVAATNTDVNLDSVLTVGSAIQGSYGKLTVNADGSYSYVRDAGTAGGVDDVFTYTIKDGDGDQSHTTLTIHIGDSGVTTNVTAGGQVFEAGLPARGLEPAGSNSGSDSETTTGSITYTAADGPASVTIDGVAVAAVGQSFVHTNGTLTITSVAAGSIGYSYTLTDNTSGDATTDTFAVVVTDKDGDHDDKTLTISIVDDVPTAVADTDSVTEDGPLVATGNVLTGGADLLDANTTDGVADTQGADGASVFAVTSANLGTSGTIGVSFAGQYGTLVINANGTYTYTLNNGLAAVQNLNMGQTLQDKFTYTIQDGDGDQSATDLTITVNGVNDNVAPVVANTENWVPSDPAQETATAPGYANGYPLLVQLPTDANGDNLVVTSTGTVPAGIYYYNGSSYAALTAGIVLYDPSSGINFLDDLVYRPTSSTSDTINQSLSLDVYDGTAHVAQTVGIHEVASTHTPTDTQQLGSVNDPLTSGSGQFSGFHPSQATVDGIVSNPNGATIVVYTDFQKEPNDIPIPADEQNPGAYNDNSAGSHREQEVQVELVIGTDHFVIVEADTTSAKFEQSWFYDSSTGLMKATVDFDHVYLLDGSGNPTTATLADYMITHPPLATDSWTLSFTDNAGGSYQARLAQFQFFTHDPGDPGIVVDGSATVADQIYGTSGKDSLSGHGGDDIILGRGGDDVLSGGLGNDTLDGGSGNDTANYLDAGGGVSVDLNITTPQTTGGAGTDTLVSIENLIGSNFGDVLMGDVNSNSLSGGAGDDTLTGRGGIDTLAGGTGADKFHYNGPSDAGPGLGNPDRILDFALAEGDVFEISAAGFGGGLLNGTDASGKFSASGNDTFASGAERFHFNTATHTLLYDADGSGGASAAIALAVLENGATVDAAHIKIVA
ncbi:DUF5801 repeats-in-toxin domain-containing protein [Bradyrhizobium diazoefficiens]|uniref:DUF5801 repeats-in-toxin domain-containing protein n=1 Tax=Bradyrhizobium diazoefficiens TaxID=1355477 RepID=UPI00272CB3DD|nr:DUF5801 repeats-in-toxin domain-containing protein [Bradyrhizobium diazoefficiens]WLA62321.1 DUF5801 repeats-in-toxin domain-containing protein [Bradyrhizobium diazoefficiens]